MDDERRRAKEAWVTGHSGGTVSEIVLVSLVSVVRIEERFRRRTAR